MSTTREADEGGGEGGGEGGTVATSHPPVVHLLANNMCVGALISLPVYIYK